MATRVLPLPALEGWAAYYKAYNKFVGCRLAREASPRSVGFWSLVPGAVLYKTTTHKLIACLVKDLPASHCGIGVGRCVPGAGRLQPGGSGQQQRIRLLLSLSARFFSMGQFRVVPGPAGVRHLNLPANSGWGAGAVGVPNGIFPLTASGSGTYGTSLESWRTILRWRCWGCRVHYGVFPVTAAGTYGPA